MKRSYQNFVASVILHLLIPLVPLLMEFTHFNNITKQSVILAGAMYSLSVGIASTQVAIFSICLFIGVIMSGSYTQKSASETALPIYEFRWAYVIISVFIISLIERYHRHVNRGEIFFLFEQNTETEQ
jgi:hypothetical protein